MKNLAEKTEYAEIFEQAKENLTHGVAAAVAIIACADLKAGLRESWMLRRATKVVDKLGQLPRREIIDSYKEFSSEIDSANGVVPEQYWDYVRGISAKPDIARMAGQFAFDVMAADGDMDPFEVEAFIKVCAELGLDAEKDFGVR